MRKTILSYDVNNEGHTEYLIHSENDKALSYVIN